MIFGNLEGLINGTEQVVFDSEVTGSAVSSISTGNILNGDEDGWYTVIIRHISNGSTAPRLRMNNDGGSNYGFKGIDATNTSVVDSSPASATGFVILGATTSGYSGLSLLKIYAKSGSVRMANIFGVQNINGTTVTTLMTGGGVWTNTADNLVNMNLVADLGIGSRMIVLKSNNFTNGTPTGIITTPYIKGAWVSLGSQTLVSDGGSFSSYTVDGDRDILYFLSYEGIANGTSDPIIKINASGGTNYGLQRLSGNNTTVAATRETTNDAMYFNKTSPTVGQYCMGSMLLFAKQGFIKPSITTSVHGISGTTVNEINLCGQVWNGTGSTTSIAFSVNNGFKTGSRMELFALRPNG